MKFDHEQPYEVQLKQISRDIRRLGGKIQTMTPAKTWKGRTPQIEALFAGIESIPGCPKIDRTPIKPPALKPWGEHVPIPNH